MATAGYIKHEHWHRPAVIGFLGATTHPVWSSYVEAFERRLRKLGWINGHNVMIEYQWAEGRPDRYTRIAEDFARRGVDVIVTGGTPAVLAAKRATKSIPIVFATAGDPVGTHLVASLQRPGGNVTGISNGQTEFAGKRVELLHAVLPRMQRLAVLANRHSDNARLEMARVQQQAERHGLQTVPREVGNGAEIGPAIRKLNGEADALYVCTDPLITHHRISINIAAAVAKLPTMHAFGNYVETGGLMSYGPDFRDMFAKAADYTDKILHGAKPADIPVYTAKDCELVVNLETARAIGVKIPGALRRGAHVIR